MEDIYNYISFGIIILIPIISIIFKVYCLKYYSSKDPHLSEIDKKNIKENSKKYEYLLYFFNILFSLCITFLLYYHFGTWGLFPIFIIGFSIIFRAIKKIKISNILCGIIVISAIYIIFINTFYNILIGKYDLFLFTSNNNSNCQMVEVEKTTFNSKFTQYEGTKVTAAQVRALITQVISSNSSDNNKDKQVIVTGLNGLKIEGTQVDNNLHMIKNSDRYKIEITKYDDDGYVKEINVTQSNQNTLNITNNVNTQ